MRKREVDQIDVQILEIFQEDAYINNVDLAKRIGLSPSPTLIRVQNLQKRGIIARYTIDLNYNYFGYTHSLIAEVQILREKASIFEAKIHAAPNVIRCRRIESNEGALAVYGYFIEILGKNAQECKECIDNLTRQDGVPIAVYVKSSMVKDTVKDRPLMPMPSK